MGAEGMARFADEIVDQIRSEMDLPGNPAATRVVVAMSGGGWSRHS